MFTTALKTVRGAAGKVCASTRDKRERERGGRHRPRGGARGHRAPRRLSAKNTRSEGAPDGVWYLRIHIRRATCRVHSPSGARRRGGGLGRGRGAVPGAPRVPAGGAAQEQPVAKDHPPPGGPPSAGTGPLPRAHGVRAPREFTHHGGAE
ncbi:MAG: hypothetical protein J3K34DRAFT_412595 [Monoraphidium minutum]|nr:MAG: hypothetical protein J3K34DRAFT_412595 [Monoraphidium minutum]